METESSPTGALPPMGLPPGEPELVSQVEKALYQLYNDPDPIKKSTADKWLQALQQSSQAWRLSWILLQHQTLEVKNFGALMLNSKINQAWCELPPEQLNALRVELFKHIARFSAGPPLMLTQLCRALVGVAFQTMPDRWPNTIVSCIHSLKDVTLEIQGADFPNAVIHLLTIFPEEFDKMSTNAIASRRGSIKTELSAGLQSVLSMMEEVITTASSNAQKSKAIDCCRSWLLVGASISEMKGLLTLLFRCLSEQELLDSAAEMLCEVVIHEDSFKYPMALRAFLQRVLELRALIRTKLEDSDMDSCMSLVKLVQGAGMANMNFLTSISADSAEEDCEDALAMLQLLMDFLCIPGTYPVDERCSEATFPFWGNFLDQLAMVEPEQSQFLLDFYSAHLTTLMQVFPDKAQFPSDEEWRGTWVDDERDDFVKYREDLCDLGECLQLTMHVEYLQHLSMLLSDMLSNSPPATWQAVEATLYLLQGVATNVTQQSSSLLQGVLTCFPNLPPIPTLIKTALSLLGNLSSWFKQHPSLLQGVLPMILGALAEPELAACAALSFRDVCLECSTPLAGVANELVPHCRQALCSPHLTSRDCVCLVVAIGAVLSTLPVSALMRPLEALVASPMSSLQALAEAAAAAAGDGSRGEGLSDASRRLVERELDIFGALCHHVYPELKAGEQHPVMMIMLRLFPILQVLVSKWCRDTVVVESICMVINRGMRTVEKQYAPLLQGTVELITQCYALVQHHKLLDSAAQLVEVFGREESCWPLMEALLQPLHSVTLQVFQASMNENPELMQAYLRLNTTIIQYNSTLISKTDGTLNNIYDIGLAALKLPELQTVSAAASLLVAFIGASSRVAEMAAILRGGGGGALVEYLLQAIAGAAPRSYAAAFTDVLHALQAHCISLLAQWIEEQLGRDGFPSQHLTREEKLQFKEIVLRGQQNKRALNDKVKEFSLKCRGFHGTIYAIDNMWENV